MYSIYSLFVSSLFSKANQPDTQMVVEGTADGAQTASRIGTIAPTAHGAQVRILDFGARKPKELARFTARNTDQALALVKGHHSMAGLSLRMFY